MFGTQRRRGFSAQGQLFCSHRGTEFTEVFRDFFVNFVSFVRELCCFEVTINNTFHPIFHQNRIKVDKQPQFFI
jgi:hypothetical protein